MMSIFASAVSRYRRREGERRPTLTWLWKKWRTHVHPEAEEASRQHRHQIAQAQALLDRFTRDVNARDEEDADHAD